jgi:hypothetical protein
MTGRFPHREIVSDEIVDGYGNALWYSLDEAYRYHLSIAAINSDTANAITVDADDDIVAVIIAPGEVVGDQDRGDAADISDYLESDNATLGDAQFTREDPNVAFNDTVITVTRAEMMAAVEQRVLAEAKKALNAYHNTYDGFPWASTFQDPSTSAFEPTTGVQAGHLPLHIDNAGTDDFFPAPFTLRWNVPGDGAVSAGPGAQDACLRSSQCYDNDIDIDYNFAGSTLTFATGACAWTNAETFDCGGIETVTVSVAGGSTLKRTYAIDMEIVGVTPDLVAPTATTGRFRNLALANGRLPDNSTVTVTIYDELNGAARGGARTLTLSPGDVMTEFSVTGVPFYLGDDRNLVATTASSPAALPRWFTENDWHHFVYYAFAPDEPVGGTGCTPGTDCLTVNWDRTGSMADQVIDKARGVVMTAGPDLDVSSPRPTALFDDYFEGENATLDDTYARAAVSANANDQLRILDPNE